MKLHPRFISEGAFSPLPSPLGIVPLKIRRLPYYASIYVVKCLAQCSEPLSFPDISCGECVRVHTNVLLVSFSDYYAGTWSRSQSVMDIYTNRAEHTTELVALR